MNLDKDNPHHARLVASNEKLLQTGKYSDLTIKCDSKVWNVHRAIVCEASKVFSTACDGPFSESSSKEIILKDDDPEIFELLLSYLYKFGYDDGSLAERDAESGFATPDPDQNQAVLISPDIESNPDTVEKSELATVSKSQAIYFPFWYGKTSKYVQFAATGKLLKRVKEATLISHFTQDAITHARPATAAISLMINVKVYAMADKFDIAELKILAREKFSSCTEAWPLPDFPNVVHEALSSTPESDRGLRDILKRILAVHIEDIYPLEDPVTAYSEASATQETRREWCNALRGEGRFLYEVLGAVSANNVGERGRFQMTNLDLVGDLQKSHSEIKTLKASVRRLEMDCSVHDGALRTVKNRGTNLVQEIHSRDHCRHCKEPFQPVFEDLAYFEDWFCKGTLRCKLCRTKHSF